MCLVAHIYNLTKFARFKAQSDNMCKVDHQARAGKCPYKFRKYFCSNKFRKYFCISQEIILFIINFPFCFDTSKNIVKVMFPVVYENAN